MGLCFDGGADRVGQKNGERNAVEKRSGKAGMRDGGAGAAAGGGGAGALGPFRGRGRAKEAMK